MKCIKKILCGLLIAALGMQVSAAWVAAGMRTVRAEEGEEAQVQIIREDRGDMEPLIAIKISDEQMDKIRQETNATQSWYGAGNSLEEEFLDCGSDYG